MTARISSYLYNTTVVEPRDRVRTKTGRSGVVRTITHQQVAHVMWDDGEEFPIRFCHLEVLLHNAEIPEAHKRGSENGV